jgi:hypothetical protein
MLVVPLLYLLVGLSYAALRQQRERVSDVVTWLIMIMFWPMHVISTEPALHVSPCTLDTIDHWIERLRGRGPEAQALVECLLDARARAAVAQASGASDAEMRRWLAPLFARCSRLA